MVNPYYEYQTPNDMVYNPALIITTEMTINMSGRCIKKNPEKSYIKRYFLKQSLKNKTAD